MSRESVYFCIIIIITCTIVVTRITEFFPFICNIRYIIFLRTSLAIHYVFTNNIQTAIILNEKLIYTDTFNADPLKCEFWSIIYFINKYIPSQF